MESLLNTARPALEKVWVSLYVLVLGYIAGVVLAALVLHGSEVAAKKEGGQLG